jgi:hypothetical protein
MIKIKQFKIWISGKLTPVDYLYILCNTDNLKDTATFYYALHNEINGEIGNLVANGNLTMSGVDYDGFNSNEYAINWVASQLKITIL